MRKLGASLVSLALSLSVPGLALAGTATVDGGTTSSNATTSPTTNINSNATSGSNTAMTNMIGQGVIAASTLAMSSSGGVPCTAPNIGPLMCVVAAAAVAEALLMGNAANNASNLAAATADTPVTAGLGTSATTADGGTSAATKSLAATASALKSAGVSVSANGSTATLGDGSTVPTSALKSDNGLASLGLSPDSIAAFNAGIGTAVAAGNNAAARYSMATDGGGGGANKANNDKNNGSDGNSGLNQLLASMNKKRNPANVSGLSKKLGNTGENIGLASDNIFEMVSRQYKRKDVQNTFLKTP